MSNQIVENSPAAVAYWQKKIDDLLNQLPVDRQLAEMVKIQKSVREQQKTAADCPGQHLALAHAQLIIIVNRFKNTGK